MAVERTSHPMILSQILVYRATSATSIAQIVAFVTSAPERYVEDYAALCGAHMFVGCTPRYIAVHIKSFVYSLLGPTCSTIAIMFLIKLVSLVFTFISVSAVGSFVSFSAQVFMLPGIHRR